MVKVLALALLLSHPAYASSVKEYKHKVIKQFPHSTTVFTQGLEFHNDTLFESAGQYGESQLLTRSLDSIDAINSTALEKRYFAEGITLLNNKIYQLTWKAKKGFVYATKTLKPISSFAYNTEGWGLTNNGDQLIMSDGSNLLRFIDPKSFEETHTIQVMADGVPVNYLNELEWVDGLIYANVWRTHWIVMIDPNSGKVVGKVNLRGLLPMSLKNRKTGVLNGIAYDRKGKRLFVTGKYWPRLYQIELKAQ